MTASKAKPVGRAVKVRRYKTSKWCESGHNNLFSAWVPGAIPPTDAKWTRDCYVITGYTGSAKTLKRLVEIAVMDEAAFAGLITEVYVDGTHTNKGIVQAMREALGLSGARKGRKAKT